MNGDRTLILLRHGKSGYPPGVADHDRPLAPRGERQAALAGAWISQHLPPVDLVLCSTAERTRQTLARTGIMAPKQALAGWSMSRQAGPLDLALYTQWTIREDWQAAGAGVEVGYGWIEGYNFALRAGVRRPESGSEQPFSFGAAFTADRLTIEYGVQFFEGGHAANGVTIRWR